MERAGLLGRMHGMIFFLCLGAGRWQGNDKSLGYRLSSDRRGLLKLFEKSFTKNFFNWLFEPVQGEEKKSAMDARHPVGLCDQFHIVKSDVCVFTSAGVGDASV